MLISDFYYNDISSDRPLFISNIVNAIRQEYQEYDILCCEAAIDGEVSMAPYFDTVGPYYITELIDMYSAKCARDEVNSFFT